MARPGTSKHARNTVGMNAKAAEKASNSALAIAAAMAEVSRRIDAGEYDTDARNPDFEFLKHPELSVIAGRAPGFLGAKRNETIKKEVVAFLTSEEDRLRRRLLAPTKETRIQELEAELATLQARYAKLRDHCHVWALRTLKMGRELAQLRANTPPKLVRLQDGIPLEFR